MHYMNYLSKHHYRHSSWIYFTILNSYLMQNNNIRIFIINNEKYTCLFQAKKAMRNVESMERMRQKRPRLLDIRKVAVCSGTCLGSTNQSFSSTANNGNVRKSTAKSLIRGTMGAWLAKVILNMIYEGHLESNSHSSI